MSRRAPKKLTLRATGMIVALGVFLIASGVVGLVAMWGRGRPGDGPASPLPKANPVMPPTPVDISEAGQQNAGRARVQFVSKNDPTVPTGHLGWASLEPTGAGRAVVIEPKGEVYLRDRASLRIAAAKGTILYPAGVNQIESGTFEGGVTIEIVPNGQADEKAPATLRIFTPSLTFSAVTGEVATADRFRASSEQFEMAGQGLRMVGNQVEGTLALLQIDRQDYVWLAPHRGHAAGVGGKTPGGAGGPGAGGTGAPKEAFYHAMVRDHLRITRRGMVVTSDRLEAWARVINGALATGAIGGLASPEGPAKVAGTDEARARATAARKVLPPPEQPKAIPGEPESLFSGREDPDLIQITWAGSLQVAPLASRPVELEGEEVAAAFRSDRETPVRVVDEDIGAEVTASAIDYGVTSRVLRVNAGSNPARLALEKMGELRLPPTWSAVVNLGTGEGRVQGITNTAELVSGDSTPEKPKSIQWSQLATIQMTTRDGSIGDKLKEATFKGDVVAREGEAFLKADFARATFAGFQRPDGPLESLLSRVDAEGHVQAQDSGGGFLRGESLSLTMEPVGKSSDPHELTAKGGVEAGRDGWTLACDNLEAVLGRNERGEVIASTAAADGHSVVKGRGVEARADQINADVAARLVTFIASGGREVTISKDGGTIRGTQMQLSGDREELFVFGRTLLTLIREAKTPGASPVHVTAKCEKSFSFNNLDGKAEAVGAAEVVSQPSALEEDTLRAEAIHLRFTPGKAGSLDPSGKKQEQQERELLRAEAMGESEEREGGAKASVESARYAAGGGAVGMPGAAPAARVVERLMFVEGDRLIADMVEGSITVPGDVKLLMDDRRASAPAQAEPARGPLPADLAGARGTTLFRCAKELKYTRADGTVRLTGGVRALHRDRPGAPVMAIDSDTATARLRTTQGGPATGLLPGKQAELLSASCDGNVVATLPEGRRLEAQSAVFDATAGSAGTIEAAAGGDGFVTYVTPNEPVAQRARKIIWDLAKQQPRVVEPAPVVIPR